MSKASNLRKLATSFAVAVSVLVPATIAGSMGPASAASTGGIPLARPIVGMVEETAGLTKVGAGTLTLSGTSGTSVSGTPGRASLVITVAA